MGRRKKYDYEAIVRDYEKGLSYPMLERKYGISRGHAYIIVQRAGKARSIWRSRLIRSGGWRKLTKLRDTTSRILSIPAELLRKAGFDPDKELEGMWIPKKGRLVLVIRERRFIRSTRST